MMRLFLYTFLLLGVVGCNPIGPYQRPCVYAPREWKQETAKIVPEKTYCTRSGLANLDSVRQSKIEASSARVSNEEDHSQIGKADEEDQFCKVAASPNLQNLSTCSITLQNWWDVFQDPTLNQLETTAVANNQVLEAAAQRYMQAKALAQVAKSPLYPSASLTPVFTKQESLNNFFPVDESASELSDSSLRAVINQYSVPLNVNYEVDLWNQLRNGYDAALYSAEAEHDALNDVLLSMTTDLAEHYFILRALDSELDILERTRLSRRNALEINQSRYAAGLANYTDVTRAQTELANVEADYQETLRQRVIQENMIATLMGTPASEFSMEFMPLETSPPVISISLPASILIRRPDIRQAERRVAASWANVGVAKANFYPSLGLAGSIGYLSTSWSHLFDWKARFWSYTVSIAQTLFDGGALTGNLRAARAQYMQDIAIYQQTVLVAFQEVEDALANLKYRDLQGNFLKDSINYSNETYVLSQLRYEKGLVTYLEVVDSERQLLEAQRSYTRVFGGRYKATVQLIRSLGGRW